MARVAKRLQMQRALIQDILEKDLPPDIAFRELDQLVHELMEIALWQWFLTKLPLHFGIKANDLYQLAKRNYGYLMAKYTGKKVYGQIAAFPRFPTAAARRIGASGADPRPLEFSGQLRTQITGSPAREPQARNTRDGYIATMVLNVPAYVTQNRSIDLVGELLRYNAQDLEEMTNFVFQGIEIGVFGESSKNTTAAAA